MPIPTDHPEIRTVSTRVVFQNRWMTVRALILDGTIQDATTVAVFGLLQLRGLV